LRAARRYDASSGLAAASPSSSSSSLTGTA
jgi:hypothetical protein